MTIYQMNSEMTKDLKYIGNMRQQMSDHRILLSYRGVMSQDIVIALLNLAENKLSQTEQGSSVKNRVFSVMVECLQNITRHSEKNEFAGSNIFMLGLGEAGFVIYSGNVIRSERKTELQSKLDRLNTMSDTELKDFYKYLIRNESLTEKENFGLGLIQIARKTGRPLYFDFEAIDADHSFFTLRTSIEH